MLKTASKFMYHFKEIKIINAICFPHPRDLRGVSGKAYRTLVQWHCHGRSWGTRGKEPYGCALIPHQSLWKHQPSPMTRGRWFSYNGRAGFCHPNHPCVPRSVALCLWCLKEERTAQENLQYETQRIRRHHRFPFKQRPVGNPHLALPLTGFRWLKLQDFKTVLADKQCNNGSH